MNNPDKGLYIVLVSVHGLIRGENPELGRDADTGGQTRYVIELARHLGDHPDVARVDLVTRQIVDEQLDTSYAMQYEALAEKARIVRLPCGPQEYLQKEQLWPCLDYFADNLLDYLQKQPLSADILHGHYADAGFVAARVAATLGVPLIFTGHSLGRVKRERLLEQGSENKAIDEQYNIRQRIAAEEYTLDHAALVITSTEQEIREQYALYDNYRAKLFKVIPPGVDLQCFHPHAETDAVPPIRTELERFLNEPDKPMILAISRPDERKNISTLVEAYAGHAELREKANLVVVAGTREHIPDMEPMPREVLTELLMQVDTHDLYGSIAYPPQHAPEDVPDLYRLAAKSRGVFINPALTEPFGLTLIEAAASGLPMVATHDGGPQDIIQFCRNGLLIDPLDTRAMADALYSALCDEERWQEWSVNGLRGAHEHYSWPGHVKTYLQEIHQLLDAPWPRSQPSRRPARNFRHFLISDIDNTLLGDAQSLQKLKELLHEHRHDCGFGIATGRRLDSALQILEEWEMPVPDILITSVGSEIHHGEDLQEDTAWSRLIHYRWYPDALRKAMKKFPGLKMQKNIDQRRHKISYDVDPEQLPPLREIHAVLRQHSLYANLIYSHQAFLDLLPLRASKGFAIRYLARQWGLPLRRLLVAGDSGNDEEMLRGNTLGVVVGNHSPELGHLRERVDIHFADGHYAAGILQGIEHYHFLAQDLPENN